MTHDLTVHATPRSKQKGADLIHNAGTFRGRENDGPLAEVRARQNALANSSVFNGCPPDGAAHKARLRAISTAVLTASSRSSV
jgi:hypothetical protein